LPVCAIGVLAALVATRRHLVTAVGVLAASAPAAVPLVLAWRATGSPVYPLTLRIGSRVVFAGNAELDWLLRGEWMNPFLVNISRDKFLERMFLPWVRLDGDFMNLGVGVVVLMAGAAGGLWTMRSMKEKRPIVAFHLVAALITIASVAGKDSVALRLWWWPVLGRLVTIPVAVAAVFAAMWLHRIAPELLYAAAVVALASSWPGGLTEIDLHAGTFAAGLCLLVGVGWWLVARVVQRRLVWLSASVAAVLMLAALMAVRERYRVSYYEAAGRRESYDVHPLDARWATSWRLWDRFDAPEPTTLAVSAGWDGVGHNWWLYPLTGRHLQNRLLYVPISADGTIVDYGVAPAQFPPTSCDAWVSRLQASQADYLVLLPPLPRETKWAEALPEVFQPDRDLGGGSARSYRIVKGASMEGKRCSQ
jgi:hypothetical protein